MENAKKLSIQHGRILKLLKVTKSPLPVHRDTYAARRMEAMSNAALMARNSKTGGDDVTREKLRPGSQAENTDPELLADFSTARTDCRENPAAQRAVQEAPSGFGGCSKSTPEFFSIDFCETEPSN
ncbi:hypothetical protein L596_001618 [Steinernema carpocapsae]|uniref:Uncharacterized protein n=1 Tax=Steinernema carpocapsae TaxID=34508 RepID=A0A4U8UPD4_STECR|nr:hypothetical protein L596_001618 [Steinernema carpocapsae]